MKRNGQDPETIDGWMLIALRDLEPAEHLPLQDKERIFELSANSVEKCLKAFLFKHGEQNLVSF